MFARLIADRIKVARTHGEIDRVVLVAAPAFLGQLRASLDEPTRRLVVGEFDLNLVHLKPSEIRAHLSDRLSETVQVRGAIAKSGPDIGRGRQPFGDRGRRN